MVGFARSRPHVSERLDVFTIPPTDLSMASRREVRINPKTTGITPITFEMDPLSDFLDMDGSYLEFDLTLKKNTNPISDLAAADVMVLANNLAHTLCKQITVRLNGTLISPQSDNYHHQAYIETLLNNDRQDGEDLLIPQGWYNCLDVPDDGEAGEFTANMLDPTHDDHAALSAKRKKAVNFRVKFLGGNKITLRFTPSLEVFRLGRLLKPGVRIQMEVFLNNPDLWTIRHAGANTLKMTPAHLQARWYIYPCRVQPSLYREMIESSNKGKNMVYPVVRGDIRTYSHDGQVRYFECNNPFQGVVPNRLVVVMMKQEAYNGTVTHNPFAYGKFNMSSIKLSVGGEEYPYETLEMSHDNGNDDLKLYHRFLDASGCFLRGHGNMIGLDDYGHGKKANLWVFDTTSNRALDSPVLNPKLTGDVRLTIQFGADPRANNGENLTILIYGEFENLLEIDGRGSVLYDINN